MSERFESAMICGAAPFEKGTTPAEAAARIWSGMLISREAIPGSGCPMASIDVDVQPRFAEDGGKRTERQAIYVVPPGLMSGVYRVYELGRAAGREERP